MIYWSSSHHRSAHDSVAKHVGIPDCLTIAGTSYKNCFQYIDVPLTELISENALSLATKLLIVSSKLLLIVSAVVVPGLILCIAKFIGEHKRFCTYTDLAKNI